MHKDKVSKAVRERYESKSHSTKNRSLPTTFEPLRLQRVFECPNTVECECLSKSATKINYEQLL